MLFCALPVLEMYNNNNNNNNNNNTNCLEKSPASASFKMPITLIYTRAEFLGDKSTIYIRVTLY